jgi:hypothetical protein
MINGIWCAPATAEQVARCSDHWTTSCIFVRGEHGDDDEAYSLLMDWMPIPTIEEQCVRRLYRTPCGHFFVWACWITIRATNGKTIEKDELTLLSRDRAWRWTRGEGVIMLADFERFPSKRRR